MKYNYFVYAMLALVLNFDTYLVGLDCYFVCFKNVKRASTLDYRDLLKLLNSADESGLIGVMIRPNRIKLLSEIVVSSPLYDERIHLESDRIAAFCHRLVRINGYASFKTKANSWAQRGLITEPGLIDFVRDSHCTRPFGG